MVDLREKIKQIIESESTFTVLNAGSVELIQQIMNNYEVLLGLTQDLSNLPKQAELVFVAAPTGAGKDSLVIKLNRAYPEKKYIELNMDIFRHYFPEFIPDLNKLRDRTFAEQTNEFAYEMYITIQRLLLEQFPGTNIIITGTLRETDWVERTFERYKTDPNTKYTVKLVSLAVPKKESAISVLTRYVSIVDSQNNRSDYYPGTARYTTHDYHDETFEKFPASLEHFQDLFENGKMIDVMEVYRRSRTAEDYDEDTLVFSSENDDNKYKNALEAVLALRQMESKKMEPEEAIRLLEMIKKNYDYLKVQDTLREVVSDLARFLGYNNIVERLAKTSDTDMQQVPDSFEPTE
jgi:hypothetical protein